VVALTLLLYLIILQPVLSRAIGFPMLWKILIFLLLTAPPAFAMGMLFPLGLAAGRAQQKPGGLLGLGDQWQRVGCQYRPGSHYGRGTGLFGGYAYFLRRLWSGRADWV
jgi:hypothetical protein